MRGCDGRETRQSALNAHPEDGRPLGAVLPRGETRHGRGPAAHADRHGSRRMARVAAGLEGLRRDSAAASRRARGRRRTWASQRGKASSPDMECKRPRDARLFVWAGGRNGASVRFGPTCSRNESDSASHPSMRSLACLRPLRPSRLRRFLQLPVEPSHRVSKRRIWRSQHDRASERSISAFPLPQRLDNQAPSNTDPR